MPIADPVARAAYESAYRAANRERLTERHREYVASRRDEINKYLRTHRSKHPAWHAFYDGNKRAAELGIVKQATREDYERLWSMPCADCGTTPAEGVDHVIALRRGGQHHPDNLRPCCLSCNKRKGGTERA